MKMESVSNNTTHHIATTTTSAILTTSKEQSDKSNKRHRVKWISLKQKKDDNLLFLNDSNIQDLYLLRQIMVAPLWEAGYGMKIKAWTELAEILSATKDDSGENVFTDGLTAKHCTDRFKTLMDFCKKAEREIDFHSGCDDEAPPTELLTLLEQISEIYTGHMADEAIARDEKKNAVKRSRDHAQIIRDASLGKLSNVASEKSTKKMKTDSEDLDLAGLVNCAKALMQSPASDLTNESHDRLKIMNRKFDLQEEKLNLERDQFNLEKERRQQDAEDRKLDRMERKEMMENSSKMQGALLDVLNKFAEK